MLRLILDMIASRVEEQEVDVSSHVGGHFCNDAVDSYVKKKKSNAVDSRPRPMIALQWSKGSLLFLSLLSTSIRLATNNAHIVSSHG